MAKLGKFEAYMLKTAVKQAQKALQLRNKMSKKIKRVRNYGCHSELVTDTDWEATMQMRSRFSEDMHDRGHNTAIQYKMSFG